MYSDYGKAFERASLWNFGDEFPRNIVILGDYKSSSTHADSCKNNPLVLG